MGDEIEDVVSVLLPHPAKELRPNGRAHWAAKARAARSARLVAKVRMRETLAVLERVPAVSGYRLVWFFKGVMPDVDNCLASCKAYLDGCCDALGVNDRTLECGGIQRERNRVLAGEVAICFFNDNTKGEQ